MVLESGAPQQREIKHRQTDRRIGSADLLDGRAAPLCTSEAICYELFTRSVLGIDVPKFAEPHNPGDEIRLQSNIAASREPVVDVDYLKRFIAMEKRIEMEQAAAIVLSAIITDNNLKDREVTVRSLIKGIDHSTLVNSCMWMGPDISPP